MRPFPLLRTVPVLLVLLAAWPAPAAGADLAPAQDWIVGFTALPPGLHVGGAYNGGLVYHLNPALRAIGVTSSDPGFKLRAHADPAVGYVEPDRSWRVLATPDDPRYRDQYEHEQVRLPAAWDVTYGSAAGKVCVVDTGVRHTHEDLRGPRWLGGVDLVNRDADPWDDHGHGTHVVGIAAAGVDNGVGGAGAGNVGFHVVKVMDEFGQGDWTTIAEGITWCADNAGPNAVVSISIGGGYSRLVHEAVRYAYGTKGLLVVAAAGNGGPCADCIDYPGRLPEVVAVSCTAKGETFCGFSSEGPQMGLAAPGADILNTCYDHDALYCRASGTSDSAPLVSGIAALFWSTQPGMTNVALRARLNATAQDLGAGGFDPKYGHGEIDAKCLFENRSPCLPPPNDSPAGAERIERLPFSKSAGTLLATTDLAEPEPCADVGATIWYQWNASAAGRVAAEASGGGFPAVLAVYATNLTGLAALGCSAADQDGGRARSRVEFDAREGVQYLFQAGGLAGATGSLKLKVSCEGCPENNPFADAFRLSSTPASATQTTRGASVQPGEPLPCDARDATVWYEWTAPGTGAVTLDTFGSAFDTVLAVHAGAALDALALVACNDDAALDTRQSRVQFDARVGTTYRIQVAGKTLGAAGELRLALQCPACMVVPVNDDFANRKVIVGSGYYDELGTVLATNEPGEPQPCGLIGRTVWYSITPPVDATAIFRTANSDYDTVLAGYTGTSLADLTLVKCMDDVQGGLDLTSTLVFPMKAGRTYFVQAGGFDNDTGALKLSFQCSTACFPGAGNDMRANAIAVPLLPYSNVQDTIGYGTEPGEVRPPYMGATAWYKWTMPPGGLPATVTVDTYGSSFDTVLAVYVADTYLPLGYSEDADATTTASRVQFTAVPGQSYMIQAGGVTSGISPATGLLTLNVR